MEREVEKKTKRKNKRGREGEEAKKKKKKREYSSSSSDEKKTKKQKKIVDVRNYPADDDSSTNIKKINQESNQQQYELLLDNNIVVGSSSSTSCGVFDFPWLKEGASTDYNSDELLYNNWCDLEEHNNLCLNGQQWLGESAGGNCNITSLEDVPPLDLFDDITTWMDLPAA